MASCAHLPIGDPERTRHGQRVECACEQDHEIANGTRVFDATASARLMWKRLVRAAGEYLEAGEDALDRELLEPC